MVQNKKEANTLLKDALTLFLITLIAGIALGFVYELTKEPIREAKAKEKQDAYAMVYTEAKEFSDPESQYVDVEESSGDLLQKEAGIAGVTINEVLEAYDDGGVKIGYVLTVTSHEGYGGDVPISIGITKDGKITGVEVLDNSETSGFGSKAQDPQFEEQFRGVDADRVEPGVDFDGISGATYTTTAVTNAINGALYYVKQYAQK